MTEGIGCIERVLAELLAQLGLALLNDGKAFLGDALQFGTTEHKVTHRILVRLALFGIQC